MSNMIITVKTDKIGSKSSWDTGVTVEEWVNLTEEQNQDIINDNLVNLVEIGTEDEDGNIVTD